MGCGLWVNYGLWAVGSGLCRWGQGIGIGIGTGTSIGIAGYISPAFICTAAWKVYICMVLN